MKKVKEFVKEHAKAFIASLVTFLLTALTLGLYAKFKGGKES